MTTFDLRKLRLRSGDEYDETLDVQLEPLELGAQRYSPTPATVPARLRVTKATTGTVLELSFDARLEGPCFRCLAEAALELELELDEYHASDPKASVDERSDYVADDVVDLSAWARDGVALALPDKILCRSDCAGLCPVCGKDLNVEPHEHEDVAGDARWAALEALRERL
jgi:uncharacterized protein